LSVLGGTLTTMSATNDAVRLSARDAARLLERQHGVLSRAQAFALGITGSRLKHRARPGGPWQRILPGTYLTFTGQPSAEQREMAAVLYAGPDSVITGSAALRRLWIRGPETSRIDVLVPPARRTPSRDFVAIHRTRRMPDTVLLKGALPLAPAARAVLDTVGWLTDLGDARAVVAGAVQERRCSVADLEAELAHGPRHQTALSRRVVAEVAAGIRSAPEADLRDLIIENDLPMPMFNPRLYLDGRFLGCPDAWWPAAGVAVEVDSKAWHFSSDADWDQTTRRHTRLTAAGILVIHVTPRQLREEPDRVAADICAALSRGHAPAGIATRPAA
jgi:hypothetical protein